MMFEHNRRGKNVFFIIVRDAAMIAVVLVVFGLFHHGLPRSGKAIQSIVDPSSMAGTAPGYVETTAINATADDTIVPLQAARAVSPEPTPIVYALGDFSATFPATDTGIGALHSYQSDALRIAIDMVETNGITYYVADVWVENISTFKTAFAKGEYGTGIHQEPKNCRCQ